MGPRKRSRATIRSVRLLLEMDDCCRQIYLLSEKAQRRRGLALAAAVPCTAQAEPQIVLGAQLAQPAARLARIVGGMQRAPAYQASPLPDLIGEVPIAGKQQIMEGSLGRQRGVRRNGVLRS